ncbi:hypothetical protein ACQY0O_006200 [Thecaphora frezii]
MDVSGYPPHDAAPTTSDVASDSDSRGDDDGWLSNASDFGRRRSPSTRSQAQQRTGYRRFSKLPAVARGDAELRSIASSFEHSYSTDLRYPLSERAEWSRLASRELESIATDSQLASVAFFKHAQLRKLIGSNRDPADSGPRPLSFDHIQARVDEKRVRWPLEADQVPLPHWTLAQEVEAIISRRYSTLCSERRRERERNDARAKRSARKRRRTSQGSDAIDSAVGAREDSVRGDELGEEDDLEAEMTEQLVNPVLLSVQQQLRRTYEYLMLQESQWSSSSAKKALEAEDPNQTLASQSIATAQPSQGRRQRKGRGALPALRISGKKHSDWRNVLGFLAQRSESTSTGSAQESAFDQALRASTDRLGQIYGTASLHLIKGRPIYCQHYVKTGNVRERMAKRRAALEKAEASLHPFYCRDCSASSSNLRPTEGAAVTHLAEASILDPTDLLVDYEASEKMRPAPLEQRYETWPLPEGKGLDGGRPRFWRENSRQLGSSAGSISLPRRTVRRKEAWRANSEGKAVSESAEDEDSDSEGSPSRSSSDDSDSSYGKGSPRSDQSSESEDDEGDEASSGEDREQTHTKRTRGATGPSPRKAASKSEEQRSCRARRKQSADAVRRKNVESADRLSTERTAKQEAGPQEAATTAASQPSTNRASGKNRQRRISQPHVRRGKTKATSGF